MRGDVTAVCWVVRGCYSGMLGGEGLLQLYAGWRGVVLQRYAGW